MNLNREPIKNWFGFTRRERRSAFIMLLIIILVILLRYTVPPGRIDIEDITGNTVTAADRSEISGNAGSYGGMTFSNDPKNALQTKRINSGLAVKAIGKQAAYPGSGAKVRQYSVSNKTLPQKPVIDINLCDSATLVRLPGIGPVLSVRIIKYRRLLGGFASIDQLKEVYGLPEETFELIKGRVFADSAVIARIDVNSASYKELSRLPYFEKYEVTAILKYRQLKGRMQSISDLTDNKLITDEKLHKVSPYLKFEE